MKLTPTSLTILKNFASINSGMEFRQGNIQATISPLQQVLAVAELEDTFPETFCVHDMDQFLSIFALFKEPDLEFGDNNVYFKDERSTITYRMCERDMIIPTDVLEINKGLADVKFSLTAVELAWIVKTSHVLSSPNISVESDGQTVQMVTFNAEDNSVSTNKFQLDVNGTGSKYKIVFKTEHFSMIPGDYDVEINFKGYAHFKNKNINLQYWIAFEEEESKIGD